MSLLWSAGILTLNHSAVLLDGCVDDCKSFETLAEAEEYCTSLETCGGITKSAYGDEEAINLGVGLYEVRQVLTPHPLDRLSHAPSESCN
jgi:hypothetical protein